MKLTELSTVQKENIARIIERQIQYGGADSAQVAIDCLGCLGITAEVIDYGAVDVYIK